jgi:hypothetical protein
MCLHDFKKEAPVGFEFCEEPCSGCYKYCLEGKGCTLGVLFETSTTVFFEWLTEGGRPVPYRPELRYKAWPKREVTRLVNAGVWEPTTTEPAGGESEGTESRTAESANAGVAALAA